MKFLPRANFFLSLIFNDKMHSYFPQSLSPDIWYNRRGTSDVRDTLSAQKRCQYRKPTRNFSIFVSPRLCHKYSATKNPYSCCRSRAKDVERSGAAFYMSRFFLYIRISASIFSHYITRRRLYSVRHAFNSYDNINAK